MNLKKNIILITLILITVNTFGRTFHQKQKEVYQPNDPRSPYYVRIIEVSPKTKQYEKSIYPSDGKATKLTDHQIAMNTWREEKRIEQERQDNSTIKLPPNSPKSPQEAIEKITTLEDKIKELENDIMIMKKESEDKDDEILYYYKYARSLHNQLINDSSKFIELRKKD